MGKLTQREIGEKGRGSLYIPQLYSAFHKIFWPKKDFRYFLQFVGSGNSKQTQKYQNTLLELFSLQLRTIYSLLTIFSRSDLVFKFLRCKVRILNIGLYLFDWNSLLCNGYLCVVFRLLYQYLNLNRTRLLNSAKIRDGLHIWVCWISDLL